MTTASVCLIAKDEARYLVEWSSHYLTMGCDRLLIYDNDSTDATADLMRACAAVEPRIELRPWPNCAGRIPQDSAYADALSRADAEWMAFLDADELLVLNRHD